jgi:hypothetical protein
MQAKVRWLAVPLKGDSSYEFAKQITDLEPFVRDGWQTKASESTGNPLYVTPTVIVMYREDHAWPLTPAIPIQGAADLEYDLVIAAQPYRARMPARSKVKNVLNPLARSLAPNGRMAVFQATGRDPGMEVIRRIWPDEDPFRANRHAIVAELKTQLADLAGNLEYIAFSDEQAEFTYSLHTSPSGPAVNIGTSTLLAAWNAATYVAQIEDERIREALADGKYLDATLEVLTEHDGLWFADESFSVRRTSH